MKVQDDLGSQLGREVVDAAVPVVVLRQGARAEEEPPAALGLQGGLLGGARPLAGVRGGLLGAPLGGGEGALGGAGVPGVRVRVCSVGLWV